MGVVNFENDNIDEEDDEEEYHLYEFLGVD